MGHFLSFGSLKQKQEEEENEYIDDEEIGYTLNEGHSEIPNCPICDKVFNSLESYGEHIKKNYYFCTKCSNLFENEIEFKKHEIKCEKCEHCGRNNHIGKCITKKSNLNKGKKKRWKNRLNKKEQSAPDSVLTILLIPCYFYTMMRSIKKK